MDKYKEMLFGKTTQKKLINFSMAAVQSPVPQTNF